MFSKVTSCAVCGVNGTVIQVEADVSDGLPMFNMVGYLSSSVKEASERVRTALKNSGYQIPVKRITVSLSPAYIRKDGSGFDLPVALSVLLAAGLQPAFSIDGYVMIGELSLDGAVRPVHGILPMLSYCSTLGIHSCIIPSENVREALLVQNMKVYGVDTVKQAADYISGSISVKPQYGTGVWTDDKESHDGHDFADIRGQQSAKRGLEIAAAGFHNVLMTGAAGAGKSMLARCLPGILPSLSFDECIEITKIYSVSGLLNKEESLVTTRPFRSPHHTISGHALIGGGAVPRPGEVSLAHNGVLFLDEFPEFSKNVIETLRQPIEDGSVTISRVYASYEYPSDFMLVAAMNKCPCGYYPDIRRCSCSPGQVRRYTSRISGPLLDRIDLNMEIKPVTYDDLFGHEREESSSAIRERVERACHVQKKRYRDEHIHFNSQLDGSLIRRYISLGEREEALLAGIAKKNEFSARGMHRILRLSRTIADLDGSEKITQLHINEAVFYRNRGVNAYE